MFSVQDGNSSTVYFPENENKSSLPFMIEILQDEMVLYCNNADFSRVLEKHISYKDAIILHTALCKIGIGSHKFKKFKEAPEKCKPVGPLPTHERLQIASNGLEAIPTETEKPTARGKKSAKRI